MCLRFFFACATSHIKCCCLFIDAVVVVVVVVVVVAAIVAALVVAVIVVVVAVAAAVLVVLTELLLPWVNHVSQPRMPSKELLGCYKDVAARGSTAHAWKIQPI